MNKITAIIFLVPFLGLSALEDFYINNRSDKFFLENVQILLSGSLEERVQAADKLRFIKSKRAVRPLIQVLKGKPEFPSAPENKPFLKYTVLQAIGALERDIAITPVINEYKTWEQKITEKDQPNFAYPNDYQMVMVVGEMLRTLSYLNYSQDAESVILSGLNHVNHYVRASAADALTSLGRLENINMLKSALEKEKNDYTRAAILAAIVNLQKTMDNHFDQLVIMLQNDNPSVRFRVSQGLGTANIKPSGIFLQRALLIEENMKVREQMKKDIRVVTGFDDISPVGFKE